MGWPIRRVVARFALPLNGTLSSMADFNFITIPELRQCLETDYRELRACLEAKAWKAVHVLAGSIVEAVLIDALNSAGVDGAKLDSMELAPLITLAKEKRILPDEAVELSTVIRKYRNLIHPGRVKRLEKNADQSGAVIAAEVVEIVAKEVARRKRDTYGFTAEQLFGRLSGGSSALPLISHLMAETPKSEIERLLIDVLPGAILWALDEPDSIGEDIDHMAVCYRKIFEASDKGVQRAVVKHLYKVYRTEQESKVIVHEQFFFRGSDLVHLEENERRLIIDHLLPRVDIETLNGFLNNLSGIGPYLNADDARSLGMTFIVAVKDEDGRVFSRAKIKLLTEYSKMQDAARTAVREVAESYEGYDAILESLKKREATIKPVGEGANA
jgi:hypothetical protein